MAARVTLIESPRTRLQTVLASFICGRLSISDCYFPAVLSLRMRATYTDRVYTNVGWDDWAGT
jgi:hypothetical protein